MIVQGGPLRRLADAVLQALGAPSDVAGEVATHLVRANLSGQDLHGVGRLPHYVDLADARSLVPAARPRLIREAPAAALFDAAGGFGQYAGAVALDWCRARAETGGLAAAAVRGAADVGRLGEYTERAAAAGMLALATAGVAGPEGGDTILFGGRTRFLGANPWAFAVPGHQHGLAFDGATTSISSADVLLARARGDQLPADCVYDRFGRPSTDPADFAAGGGLVPLGGAVAGHKGLALSLAAALFGGLAMDGAGDDGCLGGVFLAVVDPAAFGDADGYRSRVDAMLAGAKATRPGPGRSEMVLPGEAEARTRSERARAGLRLPDTTWAELVAVASRFGVPVPASG
jgi:uncharacterized oxidoreductase